MIGWILGGIATSLLFSAFESWLVAEHNKRGFEQQWLSLTFSKAIFLGNGLVAILAGLFGNLLVGTLDLGPVVPFDAASCFLAIGMAIILSSWTENYGDPSESKDLLTQFRGAAVAIASDEKIALLGAIQSLFEGSMYTFVFLWTPALSPNDENIPHGFIFSIFMLSSMLGSSFASRLMGRASIKVDAFPISVMFGMCAAFLFIAFMLQKRLFGVAERSWPLDRNRKQRKQGRSKMAVKSSFFILFVVLIQSNVFAYQYQVGNLQAWNIPTSADPKVYTNWPKKLNFKIGDSLLFLYPPSQDSVIQVTKESYNTCNLKDPILYMNNGNSLFNITSTGVFYFTSGVSGHCEKLQKLQISVYANDGSLPLPPAYGPSGALADSAPSYPTVFGGIPSGPSSSSSSPSLNIKTIVLITAVIGVLICGLGTSEFKI
ncbi:hypothetical protein L1987_56134 [Smallanthus sonchifolius]|uniref:Uncharacterized protein n=1 Tax=Smallanthus sonchifolius TaxID=185202 RepID=A0ACB9EBK1_9ASTR|nr:hypothetical protein L1987_56134 [Smallanthus sonchifolius]